VGVALVAAQGTDNGCGENDVADQAQANEQDFHWRSRFSVLSSRFAFMFGSSRLARLSLHYPEAASNFEP
jgi:hypothetical protein